MTKSKEKWTDGQSRLANFEKFRLPGQFF